MENNLEKDNNGHNFPSKFWLDFEKELQQKCLDEIERIEDSLTADFVRLFWQEQEREKGLREEQRRTNVVKRIWRRIQGLFQKQ